MWSNIHNIFFIIIIYLFILIVFYFLLRDIWIDGRDFFVYGVFMGFIFSEITQPFAKVESS